MAKERGDNYISVWGWMFILLLAALPCIGIFVVIIGAFMGGNETRKNYFRALILWALLLFAVWVCLVALGLLPVIVQQIHQWLPQQHGIKQAAN
jgi:hypothetical protein